MTKVKKSSMLLSCLLLAALVCLLAYIAVLIVAVFLRVRMMLAAWRGVRFTLPVLGRRLEKFVG